MGEEAEAEGAEVDEFLEETLSGEGGEDVEAEKFETSASRSGDGHDSCNTS